MSLRHVKEIPQHAQLTNAEIIDKYIALKLISLITLRVLINFSLPRSTQIVMRLWFSFDDNWAKKEQIMMILIN